jgi:hypothetical protein
MFIKGEKWTIQQHLTHFLGSGVVVNTCNPRYLGDGVQEDGVSRLARGKS